MDKIAAYTIALQNIELEKRAEFIIENFGTCEGEMPAVYLQAFDRMMEKEAFLQATGQGVLKGVRGLGKALGGTGKSPTGLGSDMVNWAKGMKGNKDAQKILGGTALGLGALGTAGAGYAILK